MTNDVASDLGLLAEVERYLAAVEAFRAAGSEPRWLPEPVQAEVPPVCLRRRRLGRGMQGRTS